MTAGEIAGRIIPANPPRFIPSEYAALRTQAVDALRAAVDGFCACDDRALGVAIANGQKILLQIDALGVVCRP